MLTHHDRTVEDCLDLIEHVRPMGLGHIGFKDVGVSLETQKQLTDAIAASGAVSYLEVVATEPEAAVSAARAARDLGVQRLLGGTQVTQIMDVLRGSDTEYYPFAGTPRGHPTQLGGTAQDVEAHCRAFVDAGCSGCDVLAYRATEAEPIDLVRAARRGLGPHKHLIVAGDVTCFERIKALKSAGADAFTVGTAVFDRAYSPDKPSIAAQLRDIIADCARA